MGVNKKDNKKEQMISKSLSKEGGAIKRSKTIGDRCAKEEISKVKSDVRLAGAELNVEEWLNSKSFIHKMISPFFEEQRANLEHMLRLGQLKQALDLIISL